MKSLEGCYGDLVNHVENTLVSVELLYRYLTEALILEFSISTSRNVVLINESFLNMCVIYFGMDELVENQSMSYLRMAIHTNLHFKSSMKQGREQSLSHISRDCDTPREQS